MSIRKFSLFNKSGLSYDLSVADHFFYNPKGLGYSETASYQKIGNYYKVLEAGIAQAVPAGSIIFPEPDSYLKYNAFMRFVMDQPLIMVYAPYGREFRCQVRLKQITKTEIAKGGLNCEMTFAGLSPWYRTIGIFSDSSIEGGKVYPYTYDYTYSSGIKMSVSIDSDSFLDSPCKIVIYGPAINPVWRHYVNNVLVSRGKLNGTISANRKVIIDTTSIPYSIKQYDLQNNLINDMYQYSDFSTDRFFLLKYGNNRIVVAHDGTNDLTLYVEGRIEYESV